MKLKPLAQSLLRQNYHVTHLFHSLRLWGEGLKSSGKIVIYQMGKVGSTTIWESLESLSLDVPIYHIHTLKPEIIEISAERNKASFPKLRFIYSEVVESEYLRKELDQEQIETPWNVITLVRDPIARTLSRFFQQLERELHLGADYRKKMEDEGSKKVVQEIVERFHKEYIHDPNFQHPFAWFNYELKDNLGVDIFKSTPLSGRDYCVYNSAKARVLLLKLESLSHCYQDALQDFLGIQDLNLIQSNVRSQKRYGSLYKDFLKAVELPDGYIDKLYGSDLVKHFYSDAEIERLSQRWRKVSVC